MSEWREYDDGHVPRLGITNGTAPCERHAIIKRLSDVAPEELRWLWPARIPLGKVSVLVGDPDQGKSLLTIDMAARVSTGQGWPDSPEQKQEPRGVVLLSAEDDLADTIRPRLDAAGAAVERVISLDGVRRVTESGATRDDFISLAVDLAALDQAIDQAEPAALVVIDPITAYLGGEDSNDNGAMRGLLAQLAALAARRKVAVVCVSHIRKAAGRAVHRTVGSLAFVAAARAVWAVGRDPKDPNRRLLLRVKANLAPDGGMGLAFGIVGGCGGQPVLSWSLDPVDVDPEEVLGDRVAPLRRRANRQEAAEDFLAEALADGPREAGELKDEAAGDGLSASSVDRASRTLGVLKTKPGGAGTPWVWSLPRAASNPDTHDALTPLTPCEIPAEKDKASKASADVSQGALNGGASDGELWMPRLEDAL